MTKPPEQKPLNHLLKSSEGQWKLAAIWPPLLPNDSEGQRRNKVAVRGAQAAVVAMIFAPVIGAILFAPDRMTVPRSSLLVVTGLVYAIWCLFAVAKPINELLCEDRTSVEPKVSRVTGKIVCFFVVQLTLAGFVFTLGNLSGSGPIAWLVLLPPVAHAVILLPFQGVVVVGALSAFILGINVVIHQSWAALPGALVAFSSALFFTVVFTQLAVSAERSRNRTQALAGELAMAYEQLQRYALQAEELAAVRERNRLAREIHDIVGHTLTAVDVHLKAAMAVKAQDPARAAESIAKAQELTQEGLGEIRRSVAALRASPFESFALVEGLQRLATDARASGLAVDVQVVGEPRALSKAAELSIYRAAQEGLTNVRKHSGADAAELILKFTTEGKTVLEVADLGKGGAPEKERGGFGLIGLRERAALLKGEVRIISASEKGFRLQFEVPA